MNLDNEFHTNIAGKETSCTGDPDWSHKVENYAGVLYKCGFPRSRHPQHQHAHWGPKMPEIWAQLPLLSPFIRNQSEHIWDLDSSSVFIWKKKAIVNIHALNVFKWKTYSENMKVWMNVSGAEVISMSLKWRSQFQLNKHNGIYFYFCHS